MNDDNGFDTFEDLGYEREDWIPVFEPLERNLDLANEYVPDDLIAGAKSQGSQVIYSLLDGSDVLWLEFGPSLRRDDGQMLSGTLHYAGPIDGEPIQQKHREFVESCPAPHLTVSPIDYEFIARIELPENYNQDDWQETVDATVSIVKEAQCLQDTLNETIGTYEI